MFALDVSRGAEAGVALLGVASVPAGLRRDDGLALLHIFVWQVARLGYVRDVARRAEAAHEEALLRSELVRARLQAHQSLRLAVLPADRRVEHLK